MPSEAERMAWAVFHKEFNWRRPRSKYSFNAKPSPEPQSRVHDFVDAAVAAGAATLPATNSGYNAKTAAPH